jgi:beta-glucosidase
MPGSSSWAEAHEKAVALVSQMTLEEKVNITVGYVPQTGCSGETGTVPRLKFPGLCLSDAGNGLRNTDFVNSWPSGIHVGASWNKNLAYQRGLHMGGEFKKKGVNVMLGPLVGPIGRVVEGGRDWEGFSTDREYPASQLKEESHVVQHTSLEGLSGTQSEASRKLG